MNCPSCHAPNENDAKFCTQCGMGMFINPSNSRDPLVESNKVINGLMVILGINAFIGLFWLVVQKIVSASSISKNPGGEMILYLLIGWVPELVMMLALIIIIAIIRNNWVRVFLGFFLLVKLGLQICSRFVHL